MAEDRSLHPSTSGFDSEKLQVMVDQVWDPIVAIDRNGRIQFFNAAAEDLFGYSAEEVLGESAHELLAPDEYADDIERGMQTFRETGEGHILGGTRELEALTREGKREPVEITVNPYRANGELYAVAVIRDISERKDLEEELAQRRDWAEQYFELAGTIMVELDTDGTINRINDRGRRLLGYDRAELVGEDWFAVATPPDSDVTVEIFEQLRDCEESVEVHENEIVTKTGERRTIKWHNTLLRDRTGAVAAILSSGTDITARRRQEEELRLQNERLDEFASVVSHDLRNPLSVARGRAELLAEDVDSPHLPPLLSSLERMENIVEDTLQMSRDGKTVGETEPIELSDLVRQSWEMVATADASLSVEDQVTIDGDDDRLRRLFENLFRNGVEHGGDSVTVRVGVSGEDILYVEDDGPGIPEEAREDVFEPGHTSRRDGTGFGLAIVRRIAAAHGWNIRVTEGTEGGARFEMSGVRVLE
ncbi:PAS domain S-box protein [Halanaeroarchaeum sulfurireducens]|uniref:histidine kinase n=1 Tax=Halanaeroarchaeum sulfurireducens TaxID=1604004 RepID=A0A0F7P884_9EURY|nr:PAS domain S-box protein [Halanaeroarchaeum sulfurireducens]AKH96937.1 putative signal-transducing histidine kinase / response regulator [Halanaeroarchaeum sulfurireducens]ALG81338.1 putative signal-transducing histidine kinase / response regulator [Halanaeroarchaeum sulfurireducens]